MEKTKITKTQMFEAMMAVIAEAEQDIALDDVTVTMEDMIDFCNTSIAQLADKADKARIRNKKKAEAGDALRELVLAQITDDWATGDAIFEAVLEASEDKDITKSKIVARLTQLVNLGAIVKEQTKIDKRKIMQYRLASADAVDVEDAVDAE